MAFIHGKNTAVFVNAHDLSAFFNDASPSVSVETAETTAFGSSDKTYIPGLSDATVSVSGMFDGSADAIDEVLSGLLGVEDGAVATVAYGGATKGNRVSIAKVEATSYDVSAPVGDVVAASAELQADGGLDNGVALTGHAAVTATGTAASEDHGASTSNGGIAVYHATANTRDGATTIKVQHSADNSTWADLVTFSDLTAATTGSGIAVVASGTTVNRYLRANYTLAGSTGSITFILSFARR